MQDIKRSHRVFALPDTGPGKIALGLVAAHAVLMLIFNGLVVAGQRGGATIFDNLWLTVPILLAGAAAVGGGVIGAYAIITREERSIFLWIAMALGAFVGSFALGEVLMPH